MREWLVAVLGGLGMAGAQAVDVQSCLASAAAHHRVPLPVLVAMAAEESGFNALAIGVNNNRTTDIGLMQTNTVHLADLAKYGIGAQDLRNGCVSAYVGAWMYRKKIEKYGNTWRAVGAYHSETPHIRDAYAARVQRRVQAGAGVVRSARLVPEQRGPAWTPQAQTSQASSVVLLVDDSDVGK